MTEQTKGLILKPYEQIKLTQLPNNGWIIEQGGFRGELPSALGAYTDTKDMLYALMSVLTDGEHK